VAAASNNHYAFLHHFNTIFSIGDPGETATRLFLLSAASPQALQPSSRSSRLCVPAAEPPQVSD
jgi:hypothetical protein